MAADGTSARSVHGARANLVADTLERSRIGTPAEAVVEFLVGDAGLFGRCTQQRLSDLLLVFFLGEVANRNTVGFGPAVDLGRIGFADLAERSRRGNRKATLPMEKPAHLADGLQLGHVRLQEDAI